MIDYHVHTLLCNHATGTMETYVRSAIDKGLSEICFLDHLILGKEGRRSSMTVQEVPFYVETVRQIGHRYRRDIAVRVGLEVDFDPEHFDILDRLTRTFSFDVIAGSVHFVHGVNLASRKSKDALALRPVREWISGYTGLLTRLIREDRFDMICHVDLPRKLDLIPPEALPEIFHPVLTEIRDHGRVLELNTGGLSHAARNFYPDPILLPLCRELGIRMTLGSDAHSPEDVGRGFDLADLAFRTARIDTIYGFHRRKPIPFTLTQDLS